MKPKQELSLFIPYRVERTTKAAPSKPFPFPLRRTFPSPAKGCCAEHRFKIALIITLIASIHIFVLLAIRQGSARLRVRLWRASVEEAGFANSPSQFAALQRLVLIDACRLTSGYAVEGKDLSWHLTVLSGEGNVSDVSSGSECARSWQAPKEGLYAVQVTVIQLDENGGTVILEATEDILVKDVWIVVLGDSFASGQGNPDQPLAQPLIENRAGSKSEAGWLDAACQRSRASWAFRAYARIREAHPEAGVLFSFLACAGASIRRGLLPDPDQVVKGQLESLVAMQGASGGSGGEVKRPDAVFLSVGGNDMGISELLFALLWGSSGPLRSSVPDRIHALERDFREMADYLRERVQLRSPADVYLLEYYDIAHNELGRADASCGGLFAASDSDLDFASSAVLSPLNKQLASLAHSYGWTFVGGIQAAFDRHGYCSRDSYVVSVEESFRLQGSCYGAFHPNAAGHRAVASLLWPRLPPRLRSPPISDGSRQP